MRFSGRFLVSLSSLLFCGCLTGADQGAEVTEREARSLVSTFIGDKAWELESGPPGTSAPAPDGGYFHFWVVTEEETQGRIDFFVQRSTGDLYASPGGALMQTRAVLETLRSNRLPADLEDSVWIPCSEEGPSSTLTLTRKTVRVESGAKILTGSVVRYAGKDREIVVEWISLYDRTTGTSTDLEDNGSFRLGGPDEHGLVTIRALATGTSPSLDFLRKIEWRRDSGE